MIRHFSLAVLALLIGAGGFALSHVDSVSRAEVSSEDVQIRFGRSSVILPCVCRNRRMPGSASGNVIVSVVANEESDTPLNYRYTATGGRIIGHGPSVVWDFNDNSGPGNYSVTVIVDDNDLDGAWRLLRHDRLECAPQADDPVVHRHDEADAGNAARHHATMPRYIASICAQTTSPAYVARTVSAARRAASRQAGVSA